MVSFAMSEEMPTANSYYLSSLPTLKMFYEEFTKTHHRILIDLEKHKIQLPQNIQDKNLPSIVLVNQQGKSELKGNFGKSYITHKELFILNMVRSGYSYKCIAEILGVSARTVDTYLARAKDRTGYRYLKNILRNLHR